jgi:hypothetical protein
MMRWLRPRRDDAGAVAIVVAIAAVLLMGMAALAVDIGQAYVVKREVQKRTDFAALAGGHGDNLPTPATTGTCPYGPRGAASDQAVKDVAAYYGTEASNSAVTASQLVDCTTANGEVLYGSFTYTNLNSTGISVAYDKTKLTVISPNSNVDFAFAPAMDQDLDDVDVNAVATVQIGSRGLNTVPLYAFTGCDYGGQTLVQPNNGHAAADVLLANGADSNVARLSGLATNPSTVPAQVPLDVTAPDDSLIINGTSFSGVTKVGFFESGTSGPGPAPVEIDNTQFSVNAGNTQIAVPHLPTGVTGTQSFWYVRVFIAGSVNKWSPVTTGSGSGLVLNALPLRVGEPTLTCGQGSSGGNFGRLLVEHSQGPNGQNDNVAYNIAAGLEHGLTEFPNAASNWLCTASSPGAKMWPTEGTNCVDTRTGMALDSAQDGFIDGVDTKPGLLTKVGAGTGCAADGVPATRVFGMKTINNDTLSCFFTNDTTQVGDINGASYSGPPVLSAAIYDSPRFSLVPVLGVQPSNGGSNRYQIVGFRPSFITDQSNAATRTTPATATNGITGPAGSLESLQVIFINEGALPPLPDLGGPLIPYTGSGHKILRLMN